MLLMPDPVTFQALQRCHPVAVKRMVESIHLLREMQSDRWQLSGYAKEPGWIGLFVGWYFAVGLYPDDYTIIVDREVARSIDPLLFDAFATKESGHWKQLARLRCQDADVEDVLETFAAAHELGLEIALRGGGRPEPHRPDMWSALALVSSSLPVPCQERAYDDE
ncbi:MAG: hypothetical protein KC435_09435 [Thermomicrobiales bacterium]|nr:hypothetical protein [Thermomicrobiales bacterium]